MFDRCRLLERSEKGNETMNGAESLVRTLLAGGVNVCFTNPGTSEMHFVAAQVYRWMNSLNQRPSLRRSGTCRKPWGRLTSDPDHQPTRHCRHLISKGCLVSRHRGCRA